MMLYTSLLYNTTPIHCTPLPLHAPVINTQVHLAHRGEGRARDAAARGPDVRGRRVDIYIYIYIYVERERERLYIYIYLSLSLYIYIYIYIHNYVFVYARGRAREPAPLPLGGHPDDLQRRRGLRPISVLSNC